MEAGSLSTAAHLWFSLIYSYIKVLPAEACRKIELHNMAACQIKLIKRCFFPHTVLCPLFCVSCLSSPSLCAFCISLWYIPSVTLALSEDNAVTELFTCVGWFELLKSKATPTWASKEKARMCSAVCKRDAEQFVLKKWNICSLTKAVHEDKCLTVRY